jgi:hypothetical protein
MGRPPIGKQAMTAAQRQRRHRARSRETTRKTALDKRVIAAIKELDAAARRKDDLELYEILRAVEDRIAKISRKAEQQQSRGHRP